MITDGEKKTDEIFDKFYNKIFVGEGGAEEEETEIDKEMADEAVDEMVSDESDNSIICGPSDYE